MSRLVPFAALALISSLVAPMAVATPSDCAVFGEIADKAVVERQEETEMMDAMVKIAEQYTGDQQRFAGAVALIVDHVWSLDEALLSEDVGAAWQAQCESQ